MSSTLTLLPQPQKLALTGGTFVLADSQLIAIDIPCPADLFFTAQRAQAAFQNYAGVNWEIAGGSLPAGLVITLDDSLPHSESYRLTIDADGIRVAGRDLAGAFYGVMTLIQLVQTHGRDLPTLSIDDWPDLLARGVMLDISRDKVPTMETLYHLVDLFAGWKINQLQLYTEHTFAYHNHREVWEKASPMTAEQILALDAHCRARFVELVPNQNSFGHMHRWFEHERYLPLAEIETEFENPWGSISPPFSLSPAVPASLDLVDELYAELLPNFTSRMFNVGCDETIDLGLGRSKDLVARKGKGRVYLDFLLEIYQRVQSHGHTMQFWGDIINQYPDLVPEVPKDTIALEWGYEADHDFPGKTRLFAESGVPFYVCPGTSSWNTIAGRTDNCMSNIRNAVENGLKHGTLGILNTDWGDNGHWQTLPISYLGFAYGAALGWSYRQNIDLDLRRALDAFVFQDKAGVMGKLAYDLGNIYQVPGIVPHNGSFLFHCYGATLQQMRRGTYPGSLSDKARAILDDDAALTDRLLATLDAIDGVMKPLDGARMAAADADLIRREFVLAAQMLRHGVKRALLQLPGSRVHRSDTAADLDAIEAEYRALWLARNRPGGLEDSVARLFQARHLYTEG
jgi:hexosaminidase